MIKIIPSPILLDLGIIKIYWYGVIFVLAIIIGMFVINRITKKDKSYDGKKIEDLYFYLIIFGIIGARLYSVFFFDFDYYRYNLIDILKIWQGGIAIQGAIISCIITIYLYCKKNKLDLFKYLDLFVLVTPLAQSIGRWGNFFNGELYGKISNLPWAIYIRSTGFYHHPTFFYESILDLILFFILLKFFNLSKHKNTKKKNKGQIFFLYILGYGIIRFLMEFIRIDETPMLIGIRLPQIISLVFIIFASYFLIFDKKLKKLYH